MSAASPAPIPRQTRQLEATYEVLRVASDHPTADEVFARVRRTLPSIGRGTVYRNLAKLTGDGRLRLVSVGRAARYDARTDPHDHFVCGGCGAVLDVPARTGTRPETIDGHEVEGVTRTYHGRCRRCTRPQPRSRS